MLVDYPDSNSEDDNEAPCASKQIDRKRKAEHADNDRDVGLLEPKRQHLPPLPSSFHSLYATNVRTSATDDPSLHAGRTRQVPHVVGNWPTHVYLEWYPSKTELGILDEVIQTAGKQTSSRIEQDDDTHSLLRSDLGAILPLHISLSAPLVLKTDQKASFQESIRAKLDQGHFVPFTVHVAGLDWVANHDRTRFFLVLKLSKPDKDDLNKLLLACNATARQFGLPQLYEGDDLPNQQRKTVDKSDAFHISIAWTLREPDVQARERLTGVGQDQARQLKVGFSMLKLKIGNTVVDMPPNNKTETV